MTTTNMHSPLFPTAFHMILYTPELEYLGTPTGTWTCLFSFAQHFPTKTFNTAQTYMTQPPIPLRDFQAPNQLRPQTAVNSNISGRGEDWGGGLMTRAGTELPFPTAALRRLAVLQRTKKVCLLLKDVVHDRLRYILPNGILLFHVSHAMRERRFASDRHAWTNSYC
ncbi:hypothetical protein K440DRAFT_20673 [Wilcoxina mikolae CBS 423.85]|nr:hypothetical protein K440DRAFT_20673 [Wilcoxina mikolae CBS 423.85]